MQRFKALGKLVSGELFSPLFLLTLILIFSNKYYSQKTNILIDENFSDWQNIEAVYSDPQNEFPVGSIDLGALKITSDSDYLYLYLETGTEVNLQNNNNITLFIDLDNNSMTGSQIQGIGADLEYNFGGRQGKLFNGGIQNSISHINIGLVSSPTVTSDRFEIALSREIFINGNFIPMGNSLKFVIHSNRSGSDKIPEENFGVSYTFPENMRDLYPSSSIQKRNNSSLRIMSYNVLNGGLFNSGRNPSFRRILGAIKPDIICFQEIYDQSSSQTAAEIESILPSPTGSQWFHSKVNPDLIVISKYVIKETYRLSSGNIAVLIDLNEITASELLLIGAHPPCCDNDILRQKEIDEIMSFVRDSKTGSGALPIKSRTPIVLLGDLNLVGLNRQITTLLSGDIFDEQTFGADFFPDWDGSDLEDTKPYTTNKPATFTWYDEGSSFSPGRLDYIIYSGSALNLQNSFSLFTQSLHPDTLSYYNLEQNDVIIASDHLPLVADFSFSNFTDVKHSLKTTTGYFILEQNYPNPFNPVTTIKYEILTPHRSSPYQSGGERERLFISLIIYDIMGSHIKTLVNGFQSPGNYEIKFDSRNLTSGTYLYRISTEEYSETRKMIILK